MWLFITYLLQHIKTITKTGCYTTMQQVQEENYITLADAYFE